MKEFISISLAVIITFVSFAAKAEIIELEKNKSKVIYTLTSYGIPFKIKALPATGNINLKKKNYLFELSEINMKADFTSKLKLFRKLIDYDKYPYFSFVSETNQPVSFKTSKCFEMEGNLMFHGISKKITVKLTPSFKDGFIVLQGFFSLKMSEFGITPPRILFLKVDDLIKTRFELVTKYAAN